MVSDYFPGRLRLRKRRRPAPRDRQYRVRRARCSPPAGPGRRHRRLDPPHDGSRLSRNPRRLLVDRLARSGQCPDLRLSPQLQSDQPQRGLRRHEPLAFPHRRPGQDAGRASRKSKSPRTSGRSTPDHPAPIRKTPEQLEDDLIDMLERMLNDLAPGSNAARWEAARRLLSTSLKIRTGIETPAYETDRRKRMFAPSRTS